MPFTKNVNEHREYRTVAASEYSAEASDRIESALTAVAIPTAMTGGTKTVAAAATPEPLVAQATPCKFVVVAARYNTKNTQPVWVGSATDQKIFIDPANYEGHVIPINDASKLYIKVGVNGEGVNFTIFA
jgi:hypothetical protein